MYLWKHIIKSSRCRFLKFIKGYYTADKSHIYYKQSLVTVAEANTLNSDKNYKLPTEYMADRQRYFTRAR
ncbi:hypothetical protein ACFOG5_19330 [Pedobacter fastidiosus]|uniref:hypothetical protein n=1 Tax=Pedobacter fastidiosus TaxID=2765361 RepID=UPI00360D4AA6